MDRGAWAEWKGDLKTGKGSITTDSGALKAGVYSFTTRFEPGVTGTNPEELIAAAHAGCFSMALSAQLSNANLKPESVKTKATATLEKLEAGWTVTKVRLDVEGKVPGCDAAKFQELAEKAKAGCPISRLLKAEISMQARLL